MANIFFPKLPLAALTLLASCSIAPLAEFSAQGSHSIVYASSPEIANQFGATLEESWHFLDQQLPHLESEKVILFVEESKVGRYQPSHAPGSIQNIESRAVIGGANTSANVEIAGLGVPFTKISIVVLPSDAPSTVVTHELVHFRLGDSWKTLAPVLEEGLADYMSILEGTSDSEDRRQLLLYSCRRMLDPTLPGNDQSLQQIYTSNPADRIGELGSMNIYAFGWLLVDSILTREGVTGLLHLCEKAAQDGLEQIPFSWAMQAAGVPASFSGFESLLACHPPQSPLN